MRMKLTATKRSLLFGSRDEVLALLVHQPLRRFYPESFAVLVEDLLRLITLRVEGVTVAFRSVLAVPAHQIDPYYMNEEGHASLCFAAFLIVYSGV
jgi:hypothetical protein